MNEEHKRRIHQKYQQALQRGERFWPDSIYRDVIVSFALFLLLVLLATFVGVPGEPKADPADSSYVPKPEWYFLFLYKFLALYGQIPYLGKIEWIAAICVPALGILALVLLPFLDRNPHRHYSRRVLSLTVMGVVVTAIVILTVLADVPLEEADALSSRLQLLAGLLVPLASLLVLYLLAFLLRKRAAPWQILTTGLAMVSMATLTGVVVISAPPPSSKAESVAAFTLSEQISLGQELYLTYCAECHGAEGEGGIIQGVAGLEGFAVKPINSQDEMYTRSDETLHQIIAYGQPGLGMPPFGIAYGGELSTAEIEALVNFMRYTWDDRAEMPADVALTTIPLPAPGEIPTYTKHIQPLVKRYCLSCHRPGKQNNHYWMTSYEEILHSGDHAPVVQSGDPNSLLLQLVAGRPLTDAEGKIIARPMPPGKLLDQRYVEMLVQWVLHGMPQGSR